MTMMEYVRIRSEKIESRFIFGFASLVFKKIQELSGINRDNLKEKDIVLTQEEMISLKEKVSEEIKLELPKVSGEGGFDNTFEGNLVSLNLRNPQDSFINGLISFHNLLEKSINESSLVKFELREEPSTPSS